MTPAELAALPALPSLRMREQWRGVVDLSSHGFDAHTPVATSLHDLQHVRCWVWECYFPNHWTPVADPFDRLILVAWAQHERAMATADRERAEKAEARLAAYERHERAIDAVILAAATGGDRQSAARELNAAEESLLRMTAKVAS